FEFNTGCAGGMFARSAAGSQQQTLYLASGSLEFDAPAGTQIVAVRLSRYGVAHISNQPSPNNGAWWLYASDAAGNQIGGAAGREQCRSDSSGGACSIGAPGGSDTGLLRIAATSRVNWGVLCSGQSLAYCYTNDGSSSLAAMVIDSATVTLEDDAKPALTAAG